MSEIITKFLLAVRRPRETADWVLAQRLTAAQSVMALGLSAVLVALFLSVALQLVPPPEALPPGSVEAAFQDMISEPLRFAALQFAALIYFGFGLYQIGRWAGGTGRLPEALSILGAFQALLLILGIAVTLGALVFPPFALVAVLAMPVLMLWVLTQFVMALHGFTSALSVLLGVVAGYFGLVIVLSLVLSILGFGS